MTSKRVKYCEKTFARISFGRALKTRPESGEVVESMILEDSKGD